MPSGVLYITYDGLLEPLGQSQVWQYLKELSQNQQITVISYEKKLDWQKIQRRNAFKTEVSSRGIRWIPLRYHKNPTLPATLYDLLIGFLVGSFVILKHKIKIVHCRSYVPSVLGLLLKKIFRIKFLFDMRGFWADERVDAGLWKKDSFLYKVSKSFEKKFLLNADYIISLTQAGLTEIQAFPYLTHRNLRAAVIPTCVNLDMFKFSPKNLKGQRFILGYVGTASGWYLFTPVLIFFKKLKETMGDAQLVILNKGEHELIKSLCARYQIDPKDYLLREVEHAEMAYEIQKMNLGVFFIKPVFSKKASCATKLGEFLACGIPCISNEGIGDMSEILKKNNTGLLLNDVLEESLEKAVGGALALASENNVRQRCRETAEEYFSLKKAIIQYENIYRCLL